MRPSAETLRSRRRRQAQTQAQAEPSKKRLETEVASIETGLKLLDVFTAALKDLKERGQDAAGDIKLALDVRHAPRDWSNAEILSVMSDVIDEHPRPRLEFVLGVLGVSKVPESLDERLRSQGAKAYAVGVRTRALRKKKEAKERAERERREKKEREERERREEQERKERIEREEREERERLERERAEEERKKAAQKSAEPKRGRGRGRRGRRGRPPTRVVATERAKKSETEKETGVGKKPVAAAPREERRKGDAMEVDTRAPKRDSGDKKASRTDTSAVAKAVEVATDSRGTKEVVGAKIDASTANAQTESPKPKLGVHTIASQQSKEKTKEEASLLSEEDAAKAHIAGSTKQAKDSKTPQAANSEQENARPRNAEEKRKRSSPQSESQQKDGAQPNARNRNVGDREPATATKGGRNDPTTDLKSTDGAKKATPESAHIPPTSSKVATPKIIEEAKIASALKESAAAVNGEIREVHPGAGSAKDIAADVGTGAVHLPRATDTKVVTAAEAVKKIIESESQREKIHTTKNDVEVADGKDVKVASGRITPQTKATKESTVEKLEAQAPEETDAKAAEKEKATESPLKSKEKAEENETGGNARVAELKEDLPTDAVKSNAKVETEPKEAAEEAIKPSEDQKVQAKPEKQATEAENETKAKEADVGAEDFMADVFGSDEEHDKDDTEEASEKRGRRYQTRGRQSDASDGSDAVAASKRASDEEAPRERRKRGRPKGGARRMSRRMSNMRDEIVVAPTGRRMRRESRNLINRAWNLPERDQYLLECVEVWERVHANKISIPFREPVAAKDAPGYFDVVKRPMDLKSVKDMLQDGRIGSPVEFYENMRLIVSNALLFNDRESDLYELATELRELIRKDTKPIVKAWREARGLDSEESESESEVESVRKRGRGRPKKRGRPPKKKKRKRQEEGGGGSGGGGSGGGAARKKRMLRRSSRNAGEDDE